MSDANFVWSLSSATTALAVVHLLLLLQFQRFIFQIRNLRVFDDEASEKHLLLFGGRNTQFHLLAKIYEKDKLF